MSKQEVYEELHEIWQVMADMFTLYPFIDRSNFERLDNLIETLGIELEEGDFVEV